MVEEEDGKTEPVFWGKKWHEGDLRRRLGLGEARNRMRTSCRGILSKRIYRDLCAHGDMLPS